MSSSAHSERIISHMNKDHQLALIDYVVVYGDVDPKYLVEDSVQIKSVDEKQIVIEYDRIKPNQTKTLLLYWSDAKENEDIKVNGLSDIKSKLISMAKYCANEQGFEVKKLTKVIGPTLLSLPMYPIWLVLILNSINPIILRNLFKNDNLLNTILSYLPSNVPHLYSLFENHSLRIAIGLGIVHATEVLLFTRNYLRKYRTPTIQRYQWYIMHLIEGFFVILRLKNATK
ncbi:unnamed protein product [Candida verbasci]|uniref:DUF2470 domain-containing protein n=1 Tax=Candida verbasci TaxID=1227364 RepID=A0A9W4TSJ6_9ASCO|nr:unnamed protein product [Candida verbasci]